MLIVLSSLFVTSILVANIIAVKIWVIGSVALTAGLIAYPFSFLFTDVICEVYGKDAGRKAVWAGFAANIVMLVLVYIGEALPPAPFWKEGQEAYKLIFGNVWRVVLGSMVAYLAAQHHDIFAFHFWKNKTEGRYLWLRNNASTLVSQAIDTCLFIPIAFAFTVTNNVLLMMMLSQYVWKICFALADTPFCYSLVYLTRRIGRATYEAM